MDALSGYYAVGAELRRRLAEPAPGRVQLLTGPRQTGKTTLLLEIAAEWGERGLYVAADTPEATVPGWWELQWERAGRLARGGAALLLLDEVHYLPNWSRLLKAEVDRVRRERFPIHVVATGSAALQVGAGSRETMAGRFERLSLSHWSARDLARAFGLAKGKAVDTVVRFGGFPGSMHFRRDLPRWRAYIRDSIVDPALGRDLLVLQTVRKPGLLRQVFAICVGHPAEIVSLNKLAGLLTESGALETIAHYLDLLGEAYLLATVRKFSKRAVRRRSSPPKLIALNNAFLAAPMQGDPPTPATDPQQWGRWVENACLAYMWSSGQTVHYWREAPLEVDAIVEGTWGKWAVEVKTGAYTQCDLVGLLEFVRRFPEYRPLVACDERGMAAAQRLGVDAIPWREFLWSGVQEFS